MDIKRKIFIGDKCSGTFFLNKTSYGYCWEWDNFKTDHCIHLPEDRMCFDIDGYKVPSGIHSCIYIEFEESDLDL